MRNFHRAQLEAKSQHRRTFTTDEVIPATTTMMDDTSLLGRKLKLDEEPRAPTNTPFFSGQQAAASDRNDLAASRRVLTEPVPRDFLLDKSRSSNLPRSARWTASNDTQPL